MIVLPLVAFGRLVRRRSRTAQDTLADASAYAAELIGAIRTLQAFTNERLAQSRFGAAVERAFEAARDSTRARALLTAIIIFLVFASVVVILWVGAQDVLAGRTTPGTLGQFILYAVFAASGLGQLSEVWGELSQASGAAERLIELLAVEPDIKAPAQPVALPAPARGEVAFDDVRFAYPTRPEAFVLDGVSFAVAPGEKVAIVGPSGAGKSTIFHLLLRFYDPRAGTRRARRRARRRCRSARDCAARIALVPQDVAIFAASSPRTSASAGRTRATPRSSAPRSSRGAAEFIDRLPQGYDTPIGERGVTLSGGQRQRIAIARAILRDAPLLLLDEATSSLDAESETLVHGRARAADAGAHHAGDRAPARDRAVLRPHPGARPRPHRRAGHARRSFARAAAAAFYARLAKLQFEMA